jgi:DNA-binding NarL/FixJ family response regulator
MARPRKTRVLVVDDHTIVRQGLRALLEGEPDMRVVGEASDGREAVRKTAALLPEVVVMDVSMPRMNGLEATTRIVKEVPGVRVIALTMHDSEEYVYSLLMAGASGYLPKESAATDLVLAIRAVRQGGTYLHPAISMKVVGEFLKRPGRTLRSADADVLSPREREIVQLIAEGSTNKQIAALLGLSVKTIENHRTRIMEKLEIHNVAGLTRYAISRGITTVAARPTRPRSAD